MGKKCGSSSKNPQVEKEAQPIEEENLSKMYKSKFLILNHDEGARLTKLRFREIIDCKYIPTSLLNDVNMLEPFNQMLNQCGLMKFVSMHEDTYVDLITEFYTTLNVNEKNSKVLNFRMKGQEHQLTYLFMQWI